MNHYDRLSALDAAFLEIETSTSHMHVAVALVFETGPLASEHGGVDIDRVRAFIEAGIRYVPRYRQRLEYIPLHRHPVWVDDEGFNIHFHVRHTALPRPGSARQLKRLAGRITSQKLDRSRPLWEVWVVEGLEHDRFAMIAKVHHCMLDGVAGVDVMAVLLRPDAASTTVEPPNEWTPRPAPSSGELLVDEVKRRTDAARSFFDGLLKARDDPQRAVDTLRGAASSVLNAIGPSIVPASKTPLNPPQIGAYRRFDWLRTEFKAARRIGRVLGGTVNDVVLATVSGALRRYLQRHEVLVEALDYRVLMPVNTRGRSSRGKLGNRVSLLIAQLPIEIDDPLERLKRVTRTTLKAKRSGQHQGAEIVEELGDWTLTGLLAQGMRLATRMRSYNLVITNVPGPPVPLFLLGAKLVEAYPMVPLYINQALGVALFSYHGGLFWGFNADWDTVVDLHVFVRMVDEEFQRLVELAAAA